METRALKKVGETRNETFKREVTQIYTVATYVDELGSVDQDHPPTLMCVVEDRDKARIGMAIVCPTTGEVTYDEFKGT
jgi:DNA mismatch repair protein MSH3